MKCKLGNIIKINQYTYTSHDQWKYVNYLDTGNITKNVIDTVQYINLSKEVLPSRARRKVKKNSILYSMVRPNQSHYGIVKDNIDNFLVSTGFAVIDVDTNKTCPAFIYYMLTQQKMTEHLQAIAEQSVSAYPSIKPSDIENLDIILPGLLQQQKIAKLLGALDDKIELNRQINTNLEQQAQAIFKSWFIDFEPFGGTMPDDWQKACLLDIADYTNGLAMQKYRPTSHEQGIFVMKIKELRQGFCDSSSELCSNTVNPFYLIHNGDVIFSWSGSLLVDFWCGGLCGLNQHLFKVTSNKYAKWFYYCWTKFHLHHFITEAADKATTMGHIKRENLAKAEVVIPTKQVYLTVGDLLGQIYNLMIANRIEINTLSALRDALLPKLMSGEIDVSKIEID